jgi:hypothetical protein
MIEVEAHEARVLSDASGIVKVESTSCGMRAGC